MRISECCGAEIIYSDICSECKEHCNEEVAHKINHGDVVCCDGCNGPYGDNMNGGVIIGHSAYCGECADKYHYYSSDYEHKHEINEYMDLNKSFKDNVLEYRKRTTGSSDGIMRIFTMD